MKYLPKTILVLLAALALSSGVFCREAQAAPIQGKIDFGGTVTFDTTSLATATSVDLWNISFVLQRTGDFTSFTIPGDNVAMSAPWVFTPSAPIVNLWTVGGFTFDLTSSMVVSQGAQFLNITAIGTLSGNGYDSTPAMWSFTASKADGGMSDTFGFTSTTSAIPESSTCALLGIGVLALGLVTWRRRRTGTLELLSR